MLLWHFFLFSLSHRPLHSVWAHIFPPMTSPTMHVLTDDAPSLSRSLPLSPAGHRSPGISHPNKKQRGRAIGIVGLSSPLRPMASSAFDFLTPRSSFSSALRATPLGYHAASAAVTPLPRSSPTSVADDTFCLPCEAAAPTMMTRASFGHHSMSEDRPPTSLSSSGNASGGSGLPTPQNLRDNPERLAKVKTEMCHYFQEGGARACPYGANCENFGVA